MNLDKLMAISGLPGIYKHLGQNKNGMIVEDLSNGQTKFVPTRGHNLSPLDTISIYVDGNETVPLKDLFSSIRDKALALPENNADAAAFKQFFETALPQYDRDRVYLNDMKKAVRWYSFLEQRGLLVDEIPVVEPEEVALKVENEVEAAVESVVEAPKVKAEKPVKAKAPKAEKEVAATETPEPPADPAV